MSNLSTTTGIITASQTNYDENYWQAFRIQTTEWIVAECISVTITCFAVYLVLSLMLFEMRKRGILVVKGYFSTEYSTTTEETSRYSPDKVVHSSPQIKVKPLKTVRKQKPSHEERYETWLRFLNLCAAIFAMLKCFTAQIDLIWGIYTTKICTGYAFITVILNGSSLISVYLLLWLRQWAIHSHPALQHLPVRALRRISWALLGVILVVFTSLCVLFFVTIKVENSSRGCMFADEGTVSQGARSASGIIFTVVFQPALLSLLCYPLLKHTLNRRRAFGIGDGEGGVNITHPRDESEAKIYHIIRRLVVSVVLVTISDVGALIGAFLLEEYPIYYISIVYDVNITFGSYVIAWSFNNWRQRLLPFCTKHKQKRAAENNIAQA